MALVENRPPADVSGRVPLHYAALFGDLHRARELIEGGSDVGIGDHDGLTPLHYAAQGCSVAVANLLLANGADIDAEDVDGNTPLWSATLRTRGEGPIVILLLGAGADPHHENREGRTPAKLAKALGGVEMALRTAG
ncbi:MAG: ankyrin repeat domain-containing protein [Actinomycetota bacterium]|nr:ankyrin repeat domain-containing protein [Actinomycetota bacterium]MDH5225391.1 ankyrin repeat domain-containing protein [Actinomycetota bacterium]